MKISLLALSSLICTLLIVPTQAEERPSQKAFKGMELYSWQDSQGDWIFALLPGTNRLKSELEIKKKENQICGTKELETHWMQLAEGEQVFWLHRNMEGFAYPDEKWVKAIVASAKKAKVDVYVPPRGKENG